MNMPPASLYGCLYRWTSCTPNPAAEARAVLRRVLQQLDLSSEMISDGVLAVSELVANASEHACGPYEMRLRCTAAELVCEVLDQDPKIPSLSIIPGLPPGRPEPVEWVDELEGLADLLAERGRGLHIVQCLTEGAWGFRAVEPGAKIAWIALPLPKADRSVPIARRGEADRACQSGNRRTGQRACSASAEPAAICAPSDRDGSDDGNIDHV